MRKPDRNTPPFAVRLSAAERRLLEETARARVSEQRAASNWYIPPTLDRGAVLRRGLILEAERLLGKEKVAELMADPAPLERV